MVSFDTAVGEFYWKFFLHTPVGLKPGLGDVAPEGVVSDPSKWPKPKGEGEKEDGEEREGEEGEKGEGEGEGESEGGATTRKQGEEGEEDEEDDDMPPLEDATTDATIVDSAVSEETGGDAASGGGGGGDPLGVTSDAAKESDSGAAKGDGEQEQGQEEVAQEEVEESDFGWRVVSSSPTGDQFSDEPYLMVVNEHMTTDALRTAVYDKLVANGKLAEGSDGEWKGPSPEVPHKARKSRVVHPPQCVVSHAPRPPRSPSELCPAARKAISPLHQGHTQRDDAQTGHAHDVW